MDREEFIEFLKLKAEEIGSGLKTVGIIILGVIVIVGGALVAIWLLGYIGGGLLCYVNEDFAVYLIQHDLKEDLPIIVLPLGFGIIFFLISCVLFLFYFIFFKMFTHFKNWIESNIWEAKRIVATRRLEQQRLIQPKESTI
jgi:hypothetical protein